MKKRLFHNFSQFRNFPTGDIGKISQVSVKNYSKGYEFDDRWRIDALSAHDYSTALVNTNVRGFDGIKCQNRSYSIEQKREKKHRALARDLISLGVHLGHQRNVETAPVRPYILGYRHDFAVFDIRQSMWSLKRSLNFLRQCSKRGATSVFYYGNLQSMDKTFRLFFTHMAQQEKQSLIDRSWIPGSLTNYNVACRDVLKMLHQHHVDEGSIKPLSTLELFFRIVRFMHLSHDPTNTWSQSRKKMKKFWKFFMFFRAYQHFHKLPDVAFVINPKNNVVLLNEFKSLKIPVVGVVDSNSIYNGISYPIFGNDDNPLIGLFYFQLYMNAYRLGRYDQYRLVQSTLQSDKQSQTVSGLLQKFSEEVRENNGDQPSIEE